MVKAAAASQISSHRLAAIALNGVDVAYRRDLRVLQGLTLLCAPGRVTGIIGANGSGKSTSLKTMAGLLRPLTGEVTVGGEVLTGRRPDEFFAHGVACVPQGRSLFPDLTVVDNLRLGGWTWRSDSKRTTAALNKAYDAFSFIFGARRKLAKELSGGQQRMVEIARALMGEPNVLLLDEPTAMLAPIQSREIYAVIPRLAAKGIAVVLVDQNVRQCVRVADYVYILELGRVRAEGNRSAFETDGALRELVARWLQHRIDAGSPSPVLSHSSATS